ncbi:MAG: hypothetical protein K1X44_05685 [Alphaproteobacteria bacterium]|nr:hypothetical protein [Alphaproteobacteria bacterium]
MHNTKKISFIILALIIVGTMFFKTQPIFAAELNCLENKIFRCDAINTRDQLNSLDRPSVTSPSGPMSPGPTPEKPIKFTEKKEDFRRGILIYTKETRTYEDGSWITNTYLKDRPEFKTLAGELRPGRLAQKAVEFAEKNVGGKSPKVKSTTKIGDTPVKGQSTETIQYDNGDQVVIVRDMATNQEISKTYTIRDGGFNINIELKPDGSVVLSGRDNGKLLNRLDDYLKTVSELQTLIFSRSRSQGQNNEDFDPATYNDNDGSNKASTQKEEVTRTPSEPQIF